MRVIKVFPDYCSTGLWDGIFGPSVAESDVATHLDTADLLALKYWHQLWELHAEAHDDSVPRRKMPKSFWDEWSHDGRALVECFNEKQGAFKFIYEGDYWK